MGQSLRQVLWTQLQLWNVESGDLIRTLEGHSYPVYSISFSPDGTKIASGAGKIFGSNNYKTKGEVKLWDVETGECC